MWWGRPGDDWMGTVVGDEGCAGGVAGRPGAMECLLEKENGLKVVHR